MTVSTLIAEECPGSVLTFSLLCFAVKSDIFRIEMMSIVSF